MSIVNSPTDDWGWQVWAKFNSLGGIGSGLEFFRQLSSNYNAIVRKQWLLDRQMIGAGLSVHYKKIS